MAKQSVKSFIEESGKQFTIVENLNMNMEMRNSWQTYFKVPDATVKIRQENLDEYWYWFHERQEIWHKRVVLGLPAPWTEDPIFQKYKFTTAVRELDKLSIYYINNVLKHIEDNETSKKEIMLNTMIYRLFCRIDTWDMFGFLKFDTWDAQWSEAKVALRAKKASGASVFTSAYYVNDLKSANTNTETNSDKTENAICLIEYWYDNVDEIYLKGFTEAENMEQQLKSFQELHCVGPFTSYEWACDFAIAETYTGIKMTGWDIDSYTNVGPGAKMGLDWIFEDLGNLTHLQAIFYLRSIYKSEFKRLGYEDIKLPEVVPGLSMRSIEHVLCEYQKFKKAKEGAGRPKVTFKPTTTDMSQLTL